MKLLNWLKEKLRPQNKILVLIDWDNLLLNMNIPQPENFSLEEEFDRLMRQLGKVGRVINVFVFGPPQTINPYLEIFRQSGFFPVVCPKLRNKKDEQEVDTTDATLIEFGRKMIEQIPDLTHLCLASGDSDFAPFVREAIRNRLKVIIVPGNLISLSENLIRLASRHPETSKRMVFPFSPKEEELS